MPAKQTIVIKKGVKVTRKKVEKQKSNKQKRCSGCGRYL